MVAICDNKFFSSTRGGDVEAVKSSHVGASMSLPLNLPFRAARSIFSFIECFCFSADDFVIPHKSFGYVRRAMKFPSFHQVNGMRLMFRMKTITRFH